MKVALYARVSTEGQDPEVQLAALRAHVANRGWQVIEEFIDRGYSGTKERRPALDRLMRAAWAGQLQTVLVWRFDRFARSVKHLVTALDISRPERRVHLTTRAARYLQPESAKRCSRSSAPWPSSSATSFASA
ncbi:MAG: recombinase family protein [Gaiellaceae bacterium]